MKQKKAYIICPVRLLENLPDVKTLISDYVAKLEESGMKVHLPFRDTDQSQSEIGICLQNSHAIAEADEIHIFYVPTGAGINFDMGVAFALDTILGDYKKVVIAGEFPMPEGSAASSMSKLLDQWANFRSPNFFDEPEE